MSRARRARPPRGRKGERHVRLTIPAPRRVDRPGRVPDAHGVTRRRTEGAPDLTERRVGGGVPKAGMSPTSPTLRGRRPGPEATLCVMVGGLLRLALAVVAVLAVVAGGIELGLRAAGATPRRGGNPSHIVPDGWTGFRLRPGVSGSQALVTNDLGMHAPRTYTLEPPPESLRVAVLGSSVVYGLGTRFTETIPGALEHELQLAGQRAEVLNFGTHAFTIVHVTAQLQVYVHQFHPAVVVVVVDLQVGVPDWPAVRPGAESPGGAIERLGWWEALLKRGTDKSALLAVFDNPRAAR